jgi:predicted nuclease of predicted toxin-antitoxin system
VKILLDENLSPKLVRRLADLMPLISMDDIGLRTFDDDQVWRYAHQHQFDAIITSDRDFVELVRLHGPPPKVMRIENCNVRLALIEQLLRREALRILSFVESKQSLLLLQRPPAPLK